jgi:lipopolysaccharide transport system ATP-binding protein
MSGKNPAIYVRNLGKKYQLGGPTEKYSTFRDMIINSFQFSSRKQSVADSSEFWALKDISFNVEHGDIVGIIGRNGAGKSTLLKILSRITSPSEGSVDLYGRVGSLLEVGTGFHPELTGSENIFLSGSILGMRRREIDIKLDEIVKFSEIERFLDTPVKRYSSGMYIRLAFAVAAHLDTEILLVDEVLAVGDAQFQKKCLGKMGDVVAKEGRTVLFVSHNMAAISRLCRRAILLRNGSIALDGDAKEITNEYLNETKNTPASKDIREYRSRKGSQTIKFSHAEIQNKQNETCQQFSIGEDIYIKFELESGSEFFNKSVKIAVEIKSSDGIPLCNMVDADSGFSISDLKTKEHITVCLKDIRFYPDVYFISLWVGSISCIDVFDYVRDCLVFEIADGGKLTMRRLPRSAGIIFLTPEWTRE